MLILICGVVGREVKHFEFLELSTGKPHAEAMAQQPIVLPFPEGHPLLDVRIRNEYLGVRFWFDDRGVGSELFVWNWKTGDLEFVRADSLPSLPSLFELSLTHSIGGWTE